MQNNNKKRMLNLGCGQRYSKDWVNLDFISSDKENVKACDLKHGVPFPNDHFDVIYNSHLLEHFTKNEAKDLISDCYRVLKPGGILRIAVPDLEQICRNYIKFLELANSGDKMSEANYDWTLIEMYDQCIRNESGGEMKDYFKNHKELINRDFVRQRIGHFFDIATNYKSSGWKSKIKEMISKKNIGLIKRIINTFIKILPGEKYRRIGKFRMSGEVHQWMYDKFSLTRLLANSGFSKISIKTASDSCIEKWSNFNLDTESDGKIYKADSIYIEAIK